MSRYSNHFTWMNDVQDTTRHNQRKEQPLLVNGVKIQPGCLIFKDAYDGKRFDQTITITNYRKTNVNIRIFPPTSKAFNIKPILIGHTLSAGLSIVRHVKLLYNKPTCLPQASMDIFIDNDCIHYEFLVTNSYALVTVNPKILDFGEIDMGMVSEVKKILLTNTGTKQGTYTTDLGANQLDLMVEPTKGTIQPGETKVMTVEVFGKYQGQFNQEFWIKTEPLQRVHVQGYFIEPMLEIDYPLADDGLLILDFPKTFVGVTQQRNVIVKNHSSTSTVFCVKARISDEKMQFLEAKNRNINFKQFNITPLEGRLQRDQKFVMNVSFSPQVPKNQLNYYICTAIVDFRKCRADDNPCLKRANVNQSIQAVTQQSAPLLDSVSLSTIVEDVDGVASETTNVKNVIVMFLYGEVELPEILIEPTNLSVGKLKVYETHEATLTLMNNSTSLPLIIKTEKVLNVDVEPKSFTLIPKKHFEIVVKIRPTKMGRVSIRLPFQVFYQHKHDLIKLKTLYFDVSFLGDYSDEQKVARRKKPSFLPGIVPEICHEVGYLVDDVRFNTDIDKPIMAIVDKQLIVFNKKNDALIAFPNDMARTLKPWKNPTPCKTIFAQLPRLVTPMDVDYDLTPNQQLLKDQNNSYYANYIRTMKKLKSINATDLESEDYVTTNRKRLLMEHIKNKTKCPSILKDGKSKQSLFAPLTPYEIHNTAVTPKFIQLGRLAAGTDCHDHFELENRNDFSIHVSISSLHNSILIKQEEFILEPVSSKDINFIYHSDSGGIHHIPLFITMNFYHVFEVTVLATIVANTVKCINKDIMIIPKEKTAFLELRNPINSDVGFEIDTKYFHLESFPSKGIIPAKRNMTITITFNPEVGFTPMKEIAVISESGSKELVDVHFYNKKASVSISTETIDFQDIPLNTPVTKELIILNNSDQLVPLNIYCENDSSFPELTISPTKALLWQKGDLNVSFTFKFQQVVQFNIPINLVFQYEYSRQITVKGRVVFPYINLKPTLIKIPKVPSGSSMKTPFRVQNLSEVGNFLLFPMQDYPEFAIKTKQGDNLTDEKLCLAPKEKRELFLEFRPQEPVAYCIYLPYVLNGLMGPPELNCQDTLHCTNYVENAITDENRKAEDLSNEKLKVLKILCAASSSWLKFNTLEMEFSSFQLESRKFEISNVGNTRYKVSLKVDNLDYFSFTPISSNVELAKDFITMTLETEESCSLLVDFLPSVYGKFIHEIPIFVENYSDSTPFNHLKITGEHPEPRISTNTKSIYFSPAFIGSRQVKDVSLELIGHGCDKKLTVNFNCPSVNISLLDQVVLSNIKTVVRYAVTFLPTENCTIECDVRFCCTCTTNAKVTIYACGDSSTMLNFMSEPSIVQQSTYPLFPLPSDQSDYADLLRTVAAIMERWLYTQGYFYQNYYRIPEDISKYPVEMIDESKMKSVGRKTIKQLPLVQLLINLMDSSILKYIDNGLQPSQELDKRTIYNFVTYRNTLSFLKSQGIHVPGLKPKYLLPYVEYVECHAKLDVGEDRSEKILDEETFYRFSKQKWLDLFFHIYKVLVLQRIVDPKPLEPTKENVQQEREKTNDFIERDKEEFAEYLKTNLERFPGWFLCDVKLLLWLEYHYNREKAILWPNEKFDGVLQLKDFSDVDDSAALATVTSVYCPYLKESLGDVYAFSKNIEQRVHNACRVVQVWKSIKLSFDVHPQTIVTANKIKIMFMVTYLYDVLPHFYPTQTVTIEAPLSESATYSLNVQNCGKVPIQYNAIFFGSCSNLFKLDTSSILIPGGKSKSLNLTYMAKRVLDASIILVLSGEVGGQRYAKSMAVSVTGVPQTSMSEEIKLQVETYKTTKKNIQLKTPYKRAYKANIFISSEEPKSYSDLHAVSELKNNFVPREIDIMKTDCEFIDKGVTTITMSLCFLTQGAMRFYLYFCSDSVGDFCVLVTILSVFNKSKATVIDVNLTPNFKMNCTCRKELNFNCPKAFVINIPAKNTFIAQSIKKMLRICFSPSKYKSFSRFFDSPMVVRLLKFYLNHYPHGFMLPSCIFNDEADFTVTANKSFSFGQAYFRIKDVTQDENVPLLLHWDQESQPNDIILELRNQNEKEIRYYKLKFSAGN